MKHLLDIESLSPDEIETLIQRALSFKEKGHFPQFKEILLANLFYENSTRTRVSFELAAKHLNIHAIHLDLASSSEQKGETMPDTLKTLMAMGVSLFVIRHKENHLPAHLATYCDATQHVINAGDGTHAHPSQALLDAMTIYEHKPQRGLKIAIVGDVKHSRVANSFQAIVAKLQLGELYLVAPKIWQPEGCMHGKVVDCLEEGIKDADVIMCLRVQNERLKMTEALDKTSYHQHFGLTSSRLKLAKKDALIMHPGPLNRGVEIDSEVADGKQSAILSQVKNGVWMRMAILEALCLDTQTNE